MEKIIQQKNNNILTTIYYYPVFPVIISFYRVNINIIAIYTQKMRPAHK